MVGDRIEIFRHGQAKYIQEMVDWQSADDLTETGKNQIRLGGRILAEEYAGVKTRVPIFVSPTARTMETGLILAGELQAKGLEVENEQGVPIIRRRILQDQRNYSQSVMKLLVNGGVWKENEISFEIDPRVTNPEGRLLTEYGVGEAKEIFSRDGKDIPPGLRKRILSIENRESIKQRGVLFLREMAKKTEDRELVVVVTHDVVIAQILSEINGRSTLINPGERVTMERESGNLVVRRIGEK